MWLLRTQHDLIPPILIFCFHVFLQGAYLRKQSVQFKYAHCVINLITWMPCSRIDRRRVDTVQQTLIPNSHWINNRGCFSFAVEMTTLLLLTTICNCNRIALLACLPDLSEEFGFVFSCSYQFNWFLSIDIHVHAPCAEYLREDQLKPKSVYCNLNEAFLFKAQHLQEICFHRGSPNRFRTKEIDFEFTIPCRC